MILYLDDAAFLSAGLFSRVTRRRLGDFGGGDFGGGDAETLVGGNVA